MKKLLFLVFLLSVSFAFSQHLVQPDTLWTYGPAHFTSYPAVHPNGNVLVRIGHDVHELNGLTGEFIRKIYIPSDAYSSERIEVSVDGTKLIAGRYYVDYATGELIRELPYFWRACFVNPMNNMIIYITPGDFSQTDTDLVVINMENGSTNPINTAYSPTAIAFSNDGKYCAIGSLDYEKERTHFELYDAQTLKLIRGLEDVPSEGRRIDFIQFSENAKYVGYGHLGGKNKATFFSCLPPYLKYEYQYDCLGFIEDKYIYLSNFDFHKSSSIIYDFQSDRELFRTNLYSSTLPIVNKIHNSLILNYYYSEEYDQIIDFITSLDLNAILSGVDFNDNINQDSINITYVNGYLHISNFEPTSLPSDIRIFDLNGKIIYQSVQPIIVDKLQLRIDLQSGVYILQIKIGDKQYSQKFIISN